MDVLVDIGTTVRLVCEKGMGPVGAIFYRDGQVVRTLSDGDTANSKIISSMSLTYQGAYRCRPNDGQENSTNEIAILSECIRRVQ